MIDRRKHQRFRLPLPGIIDYLDAGTAKSQQIRLEDIGIGGAKFMTAFPMTEGVSFKLELVDEMLQISDNLGITSDSPVPLRLLVDCKVLRAAMVEDDCDTSMIAVKFAGPLRILLEPQEVTIDDDVLL